MNRWMVRTFCLLSMSACCLVVGTADPATATATTPAASPPTSKSTASAGCGGQTHLPAGPSNATTTDGNKRARTFRLQVPSHYDPAKPYPLIFVFHGAGGTSAQSYAWGLQNVSGASDSGIFVFPDGIGFQKFGVGWDDTSTGYDLPFFDNMVNDVETRFCVDTTRLFAAGFSWGGDFVTTLVCDRGGLLRAAAANSATDEYKDSGNYATYQNMPCPATARPAVRFTHAKGGDSQYPAPYFSTTSKLFQHLNSCGPAMTAATSGALSCESFTGCASDYTECSFDARIGHALPPNWAADTWAFFSTFK
jgi:poly(3-hydroxybutyrate) depolymerase